MKGPLPKPISLMAEFSAMYWTCPKCKSDFVVLVLGNREVVPVQWAVALIDFCPFCGANLEEAGRCNE